MPKKPKAAQRPQRCKRGHVLSEANVYINERGATKCRLCRDKALNQFAVAGDKLRQQYRQYTNDRDD
jgi:hypothetical protein